MKAFLGEDFLLPNKTAQRLYEGYAKSEPIIDFHNHLDPKAIAQDYRFSNIAEAWLGGDHYKWRAMRTAGVDERFITGDAAPREKFDAWARTLPLAIGNPLYHWSYLELKRYFGIEGIQLNEKTSSDIWEKTEKAFKGENSGARGLLRRVKVKVLCTTDDPIDSLEWHKAIKADPSVGFTVNPSFRPDKLFIVDDPKKFTAYIDALSKASGLAVRDWDSLLAAIENRVDFFASMGCRGSDHALLNSEFESCSKDQAASIFARAIAGQAATQVETIQFRSALLKALASFYAKKGWVMQLHMGAVRDVNTKGAAKLGPNTGYDIIAPALDVAALARMLDSFENPGPMPRVMLYNLNPNDFDALAVIAGSFQGDIPGKVQLGAAWWFNDNRTGNAKQIEVLSNHGLLGCFVGMLTDSRSMLSFPRHEYFRRILCATIGNWVEEGALPNDIEYLGGIVKAVSGKNAERYFGFF